MLYNRKGWIKLKKEEGWRKTERGGRWTESGCEGVRDKPRERERETEGGGQKKEDRGMQTAAAPTDAENKNHFISGVLRC